MMHWLCLMGVLVLAGCQDTNSALTPHGPLASSIATLTWILFAATGIVLILVVSATFFAVRGTDRARRLIASPPTVIVSGAVFPFVILSVLLVAGIRLSGVLSSSEARDQIEIEVKGEQWWWRVRYTAGQRVIESANEVRIPVGRDVVFKLSSADVIHSFWIPSLAGKMDMIPGRTTSLRLSADRPGVYRGVCAEYCGGPHAFMALDVIAMPDAEYRAWLEKVSGPARLSVQSRPGRSLFLASGCAGCHSTGETGETGKIGPDLAALASRRSIGAGVLPMSEQNLARFIADGQTLKPGNKMPPFRIFSLVEMAQLTAYLGELR